VGAGWPMLSPVRVHRIESRSGTFSRWIPPCQSAGLGRPPSPAPYPPMPSLRPPRAGAIPARPAWQAIRIGLAGHLRGYCQASAQSPPVVGSCLCPPSCLFLPSSFYLTKRPDRKRVKVGRTRLPDRKRSGAIWFLVPVHLFRLSPRESFKDYAGILARGLERSQSRKVPLRGRDGGSGKWAFRAKGGAD